MSRFLNMWLYVIFFIQLSLTMVVRSDTDSWLDNDASTGLDWDFSDVDSEATASLFSSDSGDDFISSMTPESVSTNEQSLDWFANAGSPCVSGLDDFQLIGKSRAARRDGACRSNSPKTGERKTDEDHSDRPLDSKPIEIPDTFTAPDPNGMFYPSENQDECPSSLYGARKTPMCDSGYGDDFMRYSVLGFVALEMIQGCLPCKSIKLCRPLSSDPSPRAHRCKQGAQFLAVPTRGWPGAVSPILCPTG